MFTAYWYSLREGFSRRVVLVLFGLAFLVATGFNLIVHISPGGSLIVGTQTLGPAGLAVPEIVGGEVAGTGTLLLLLAIFAAAPLLTVTLDKGWVELTFSKAQPRWKIFMGRFLGGVTFYSLTFAFVTFPLALRLWWSTHIATWQVLVALLIQTLSFAALLSVAALATLPQKGVALPIMMSVAILFLSSPLAGRRETYYRMFPSHVARGVADWAYAIFPKCFELERFCASFIQNGDVASWWWLLWSTVAFTLVTLAITLWVLERKSF
jgi:ABC-type transport system involved in multi-copper enzyme maturation permease subunit